MKEVYLVTKGSYSDYSVYGVFEDKAIAEEYAAQISDRWDSAHVSPHPVYDISNLEAPIGFRGYNILMDRDGNSEVNIDPVVCNDDTDNGYAEFDRNKTGNYELTGQYHFYVLTDKGEQGAVKIANERRIRMIAENKWPIAGEIVVTEL